MHKLKRQILIILSVKTQVNQSIWPSSSKLNDLSLLPRLGFELQFAVQNMLRTYDMLCEFENLLFQLVLFTQFNPAESVYVM